MSVAQPGGAIWLRYDPPVVPVTDIPAFRVGLGLLVIPR
jgi:hypothetical protein